MMDMFIRNFLLVGVLLAMSCSSHESPKYVRLARKITAETAKKIEEETHLHLAGTGGGMMNQINMMAITDGRVHPSQALTVFFTWESYIGDHWSIGCDNLYTYQKKQLLKEIQEELPLVFLLQLSLV